MRQLQFEAIGTQWQIHFLGSDTEIEFKIKKRIEEFDHTFSRFRGDSVAKEWGKIGRHHLSNDAVELFAFYRELYDATDGLVTPLIGQTMEQAGYGAEYSLKPKELTTVPSWNEALEFKGGTLIVKQPVVFDFGAAGKGYLVDIIAKLLAQNGIEKFAIDASGDIFVHKLLRTIGLEDPDDPERILGAVKLTNDAFCASSGNRRKWAGYHHIMNPHTLRSESRVKATWVIAETTMLADGIATALFFASPEKLQKTFQFEYAMIEGENLRFSDNFKVELFTK